MPIAGYGAIWCEEAATPYLSLQSFFLVTNMLPILKQQLRSAIGRQQRWNALRDEMHGENYKNWKHVSDLNQAGIEHLRRLLVCEAEYELRRSFASRGKQTAEDGLKKII